MQRRVGHRAPRAIGGGTGAREIELESNPGPEGDGHSSTRTDRVAHPQTAVEVGVARECAELDGAGSLSSRGGGADQRYHHRQPRDTTRHGDSSYRARLVVMTITPFAPRDPYALVDPASLSTSIRATSRGDRSASMAPIDSFGMAIPSITTSGFSSTALPRRLRWPRMRSR